jgi:cell division protein WhiA
VALTAEVKDELARVALSKKTVRNAELATILRFAGGLHLVSGRIVIEAELDSAQTARRMSKDLAELYGIKAELLVVSAGGIRKQSKYIVRVADQGEILARQTGLIDTRGRPVRGLPAMLVAGSIEEAQAVWRGAFLAHGSLTDPGRSASLEITAPGNEAAMALVGVARRLGITAKAREVRNVHRVVVREGEAIAAILTHMGAHSQVLKWEELRLRREVRATANRLANFDDANLRRSAQAAVAAGARVARALEILGDDIPEHLAYAGKLRLEHKQASLDELGHLSNPPMTKDAIAGRIRRLLAMADKRAEELGIPATDAFIPEDGQAE